jgi:hypothetical protein
LLESSTKDARGSSVCSWWAILVLLDLIPLISLSVGFREIVLDIQMIKDKVDIDICNDKDTALHIGTIVSMWEELSKSVYIG